MQQMPVLTREDVQKILQAAEAEAGTHGWAVSIAVCDPGGHLLAFARLDGASAASSLIAPQKARTAALAKKASKGYEDVINQGRTAFLTAPFEGMLEGGEAILVDGWCLGAVGVSGVKSEQDAQTARAGIAALS